MVEGTGFTLANAYSQNSKIQQIWAIDAINSFFWNGNERVLDVGCGDGKITALIAQRLPNGTVIGLDVSSNMIEFASLAFPPDQYQNLLFLTGNAASLPFHRQFDVVVSFCCLNWVLEQEVALKKIYECLVPNGKVILVVPEKDPTGLLLLNIELAQSDKWAPYFPGFKSPNAYFTEEEYLVLLKNAGFSKIESKVVTTDSPIPNKQVLRDLLKPLSVFITHLSENLQKEYIEDLTNEALKFTPIDSDGTIHIVSNKLQIIASKE
jgi:ubiquinone/menaquinone biosynthesis C-methylase UbiE